MSYAFTISCLQAIKVLKLINVLQMLQYKLILSDCYFTTLISIQNQIQKFHKYITQQFRSFILSACFLHSKRFPIRRCTKTDNYLTI